MVDIRVFIRFLNENETVRIAWIDFIKNLNLRNSFDEIKKMDIEEIIKELNK